MKSVHIRLRNDSVKILEQLTIHFKDKLSIDLSKSQVVDIALKNLEKEILKKGE